MTVDVIPNRKHIRLILWVIYYGPHTTNLKVGQVCLSVTIHINCSVACCLINVVYLMVCAFIRSWWRCTFWMLSQMTLNQHKNSIVTSYLLVWRVNQLGKLINRIPNSSLLISSLPGSSLKTHVKLFRKPSDVNKCSWRLPGKLDIKRHIYLVFSIFLCCELKKWWSWSSVFLFF